MSISRVDLIIIASYLAGILLWGLWVIRKQKMTSSTYFLAGRSLNWAMIGAALFASNISTIQVVGLAASGFKEGLVWGNFEWMAAFTLILLSLVFVPFYMKSRISTLPEFLEKRFGSAARTIMACVAIIVALFVHIGISLYAGAVVFQSFFGINVWTSILIISLFTVIYTVIGGLRSVVYTETIQAIILIAGAITLTVFAFSALPGQGIHTLSDLRMAVKPDQLDILQGSGSGPGLSWYAVFLGYPVLGIWYWCADQTIVQRVLGARSTRDAQNGALFAGFIKILPMFIMVVPGVLAYVLFKDVITDPNDALPILIVELLPKGLIGLYSAALLAALMSTVAAALNSTATLVAFDIVKRVRPRVGDAQQIRIGRMAAVVVMILAILWSPFVARFPSIFQAINQVLSSLAPPISAVFLLGVFWKRGTQQAANATLVAGFILGMVVFLLDFPVIGSRHLFTDMLNIPFMMQAWWLFAICCVLFYFVSLATPKPTEDQILHCWKNPVQVLAGDKISSFSDPRIIALILFLIMVALFITFG
jgi:SSS family solute:Na+ symporter